MVDFAQGLYEKTQVDKNAFKSNLNDLVIATKRFMNKFDCMLGNDKHKPIFCNETDQILDKMLLCIKENIIEFKNKK